MHRPLLAALALSLATTPACRRKTPEAPPEFSDGIVQLLVQFEDDDDQVRENVLAVERLVYLGMDVEAKNALDRALEPSLLTESDVEGLDRPEERDLNMALPISVAGISPHPIEKHQVLQVESDHRPWEPYSPDHYVRTFEEGRDCWVDQGCLWMSTWNELTKENPLMNVEYAFHKDFRWIDLAEEGEPPRWAYIGRSWTPKSYEGDSGKAFIHQSFTIEVWIPRDGRGYIRSAKDQNVDGGEWTSDSDGGGGVLRMLGLWSETEFKGLNISDDQVVATTRVGIDKNFQAGDDYLDTL